MQPVSPFASLPFSQACENNKQAILEVLRRHLGACSRLLEIGGGTGQHAVFFAQQLRQLRWQSSDLPASVEVLNLRIRKAGLDNLPPAIPLDVDQADWGCDQIDAVFSANSLHIMAQPSVENFFAGAGRHLQPGGLLLVYGPFKYDGAFTSESNARFEEWLKQQNPVSGVRDFDWVNELAREAGLGIIEDNAMPANNQMLVWQKQHR